MKEIYTCPMDPEVVSDAPGTCPKCGMKLVGSHKPELGSHTGSENHTHDHHNSESSDNSMHHGMETEFKNRFFYSIPIVTSILILSPQIQTWAKYSLTLPFHNVILLVLSSIMVIFMAFPFYQMAEAEIKSRNFGMMTLVSLAVISGFIFSVGATFVFFAESMFWEVATLVLAFLFGHWMEMRSVRQATGALTELAKLAPKSAHKIISKKTEDVLVGELRIGDMVLVKPGEKVPIDGLVVDGESSVDQSMITGESVPVLKKSGDEVIGGTINSDGSLTIKVTKIGSETALSQMMQLVKSAQQTKPQVQRLADRAASYLTFIALAVSISTFIFWSLFTTQGIIFAATAAIAVIVIACPHALGLAIPTVTLITTSIAAKNGILIRDMKAVEIAKKLDYVVFDKTGTLTSGKFGVIQIIPFEKTSEEEILKTAASVEFFSQHPIAAGVVDETVKRKIKFSKASNFKSISGKGVLGSINGKKIIAGNSAFLLEHKVNLSKFKKEIDAAKSGTLIFVAGASKPLGFLVLSDIIRKESKEAISKLHKMGIKTAILTGDSEKAAAEVAKSLSIDTVFSHVLPEQKIEKIRQIQKDGSIVAMVGDGVNDAAALTQANIGIAIGAGTDVAIESAQIVLMKNNPLDVISAIKLSQATGAKMVQNLFWAAGYNVLAIPAAAGVFFKFGIILQPEWSALLMSASSVIVVANALQLRKLKI